MYAWEGGECKENEECKEKVEPWRRQGKTEGRGKKMVGGVFKRKNT